MVRGVRRATNRTIFVAGRGAAWLPYGARFGGPRSCAVVHAPARRLTCGRAAAPAIVRRLPLRLGAAALAGGRNETDKRETRPPPVRAGDAFWDGCARSDGHMLRFMRSCAAAHATFAACHARRAAAHAVSRCCFDDRAALAFAIARCGPCRRMERNGQTGNAFWDGGVPGRTVTCRGSCDYVPLATSRGSCGHALRPMRRSPLAMRAALRPMPYRAVVLAIVRRLPLRLRAVALAGGWNETDKRETRPPPVRAGGACFGTQGGSITVPSPIRARVRVLERGLLSDYFCGGAGALRPAWRLAQVFFAARQAGRRGAAVRLARI